jgi:hypothetical protein
VIGKLYFTYLKSVKEPTGSFKTTAEQRAKGRFLSSLGGGRYLLRTPNEIIWHMRRNDLENACLFPLSCFELQYG